MAGFGNYSLTELNSLRNELQRLASTGTTLREAGQSFLNRLYEEFTESLALARLYATVPFAFLPEPEKAFSRNMAAERNVLNELTEDTIVVTLLATRGVRPEWNDPARSRKHLAIPLVSASFIKTIPLVGRLLGGTMTSLPWLKKQETLIMKDRMGKMSRIIHILDARTEKTSGGHQAVPAQEFVQTHGIRAVLAMGGSYLNGTFISLVLFTTEQVREEESTKFTPLINTIKTATMNVVMDCKIL